MDIFTPIIDSLLNNDPCEARSLVYSALENGNLSEQHWPALYDTLGITTKAIRGAGSLIHGHTKKEWRDYYTAEALEHLEAYVNTMVITSEVTYLSNQQLAA